MLRIGIGLGLHGNFFLEPRLNCMGTVVKFLLRTGTECARPLESACYVGLGMGLDVLLLWIYAAWLLKLGGGIIGR